MPEEPPSTHWWTVGFGALLGVLVPVTEVAVRAARKGEHVTLTVLCVLAVSALLVAWKKRPRAPRPTLPPTNHFKAFGKLADEQLWTRPALLQQLLGYLGGAQRLIVVVGPSGSGKSIALERLLLPALRDQNIRCHYAATRSHWPDPTAARDKVIVLDQFEHALISLPWGTRRAADALEEIRQDVRGLAGNARAVVLGVRSDWYIRLTFINDLLPR